MCVCPTVTSVKSARQVVDALNAERSEIDIILSEVDLPTKKGFKLLKYIMRDEQLQRIPVISMCSLQFLSLNQIINLLFIYFPHVFLSDVNTRRSFSCCEVLEAGSSRLPCEAIADK